MVDQKSGYGDKWERHRPEAETYRINLYITYLQGKSRPRICLSLLYWRDSSARLSVNYSVRVECPKENRGVVFETAKVNDAA